MLKLFPNILSDVGTYLHFKTSIILELKFQSQKNSWINSTQFPHISLSSCKCLYLCNYSTVVKTREFTLMLILLPNLSSYSHFVFFFFFHYYFSVLGSSSGSRISPNCHVSLVFLSQGQFLILSLYFLILTLESPGQLFCGIFP